ncbi:hypothetical protein EPUL_005360, partial [Erysiphe pulchra]
MSFSLMKVVLTLVFVLKTSSTDLAEEKSILARPAYYDCGSWTVYESLIQNVLYESGMDIDKIAEPFTEFLYELEPNYRRINIPEHLSTQKSSHRIRPGSNFYVIIDQMWKIVDVVTEMKNGHYIKCKRVDESTPEFPPEPSNIGPNDYGYECGHDIFSHATVQMCADLARSNDNRFNRYLTPYYGPIYWPGINYSIYPLTREKNELYARKRLENTYFVVIGLFGEIVDVVAQLKSGDFINCDRTTKVPPDVESDQDLRLGYLCGLEFFEINHIKLTANLAKARNLQQGRQTYPKKYVDDSFKGYMYPLYPNGRFYRTYSSTLKYFIIMDLNFNFKFAAVKTPKGVTPCEASMRGIKVAPPEIDNFICEYNDVEFENKKLLEMIEVACKSLGSSNRRFPAIYNGPEFNVHG